MSLQLNSSVWYRNRRFWFAAIISVLVIGYFWLIGGQPRDYTRAFLSQLTAYALGLYAAKKFRRQRGRSGYNRARFAYDVIQLLLLQAIYRNYITYIAPDQRDYILIALLSAIPTLLSFCYALFRNRVPRRLVPLVLWLLFLSPPLSLSVVGEVGLTVSSLLGANLAMHFTRPFQLRGPKMIQIAVGLILFGLIAALFVSVDLASSLYYWHQMGALLLIFFYTRQRLRNEYDLARVVGTLIGCGIFFAGWLVFQDVSGLKKDVGGANLNTVAILFEIMFFLAVLMVVISRRLYLRIAFFAAAGLYLCVQMMLHSRTGYAALGGAVFLALSAALLRRWRLPENYRAAFLGLAFASGVVLAYASMLHFFSEDRSLQIREVYWSMAFEGLRSHPLYALFGTGDTGPTYALYRFPVPALVPVIESFATHPWHMEQHPHSDYVAMLYGYGIVGTAGLLLILFYLHWLVSRPGISLVGYLLYAGIMTQWLHGVGDGAIIHYFNAAPMWFSAAAMLSLKKKSTGEQLITPYRSGKGRIVQIALFTAFAAVSLGLLLYTHAVIRANALVVSHVLEIAEARLEKPLPPATLTDLELSAQHFQRLNSPLPIIDRKLNLEAEIRFLIAVNHAMAGDESALNLSEIEPLMCQAIHANSSPLYYTRLARMYAMIPETQRPSQLCDQPAAEFLQEAARRDPYNISRVRPWLLPL